MIKKVKNKVSWIYVINNQNGAEVIGTFYEKELQKTNQQEFSMEKVIEKKEHKLYVKWKGYDSLFNSWIDKKGLNQEKLCLINLILSCKIEAVFSKIA